MKTRFLLQESVQALRHNILRSLLTVFGIIVGIISVTIMLGLGGGLSADILDRFNSFASGDVSISGDTTTTDLEWIKSRPYVDKALASKSVSNIEVSIQNHRFSPEVSTAIGDYADIQSFTLEAGDVFDFTDSDYSEKVAIISIDLQEAVTEETGTTPTIGQTIVVGGQRYEIIGIIDIATTGFGGGDGQVILPYATVVGTLSATKSFSSIAVLLQDSSYYEIAGKDILAGLNASRYLATDSSDSFTVRTAQSIIESAQEATQMITLFLGLIGGIALFVGGIGTMNMMLTTVTERTKEIGLRKAVGARDSDVLLQILAESVILTSFGGLIGIGIAVGGSTVLNQLLQNSDFITIVISWKVVFFSALTAFLIGVVFGVYPARRASKLLPVEALRTE